MAEDLCGLQAEEKEVSMELIVSLFWWYVLIKGIIWLVNKLELI